MSAFLYLTTIALFFLGLFGLLTQKNMIKIVISFNVMEASVLIFLVQIGYRTGGTYPIIRESVVANYVDAVPQALTLTAIVIGAATTAMMLAFTIKLYKKYHTLNIDEIKELRG